uniref:islet cell autoantigen 1-like isoform X2 n=1 Tax=Myxine glutinosa TaxID=7769 RepID=UPI00358EECB5
MMETSDIYQGCSRDEFDRMVRGQDSSVVNKVQQTYWKTKQVLIRATGKREDEFVVASDAVIDAKLEVFRSVQRTCLDLVKVVEMYQHRLFAVAQAEHEMGRFLKNKGKEDKTKAGQMMEATGRALCNASQHRLPLGHPLARLHQDVETFQCRAVEDMWLTVQRMEAARTEYRGALLWMKNISQELDPDTYKQLEKFRKVQTQVRTTKARFDKLSYDVGQKVDLLGASRCNLLSQTLVNYQNTLLLFLEKASKLMSVVHEDFKGYQLYHFNTLKYLQDPFEKMLEQVSQDKNDGKPKTQDMKKDDTLISLEAENQSEVMDQFETMGQLEPDSDETIQKEQTLLQKIFNEPSTSESGDMGFSAQWQAAFGGEAEASSGCVATGAEPTLMGFEDFLGGDEIFQNDKTSTPSSLMGVHETAAEVTQNMAALRGFLPSQLLERNQFQGAADGGNVDLDLGDGVKLEEFSWGTQPSSQVPSSPQTLSTSSSSTPGHDMPPSKGSTTPKNMSAWFDLFADLDPLSNPDAVGQPNNDQDLLKA